MAEYIEREAAIKIVNTPNYNKHDMLFALKTIPAASAADVVEVRHGRWIDSKEDGHPSICCVCNYPVDRFFKTKYCPNCGAKMTEDHHEQKE